MKTKMKTMLALALASSLLVPTASAEASGPKRVTCNGVEYVDRTKNLTVDKNPGVGSKKLEVKFAANYQMCVQPNMTPFIRMNGYAFSYFPSRKMNCNPSKWFDFVRWDVLLAAVDMDVDLEKTVIGRCEPLGYFRDVSTLDYPRLYPCADGSAPVFAVDMRVKGQPGWKGSSKSAFFPVPLEEYPIYGPYNYAC